MSWVKGLAVSCNFPCPLPLRSYQRSTCTHTLYILDTRPLTLASPTAQFTPPPRPSRPPKLSLLIPTPLSPPIGRGLACSRAVNPSGTNGPSSVSVESPVSTTPSPSTYSSWSSESSSSSSSDPDSRESSPSSSPPSSPSYTPHHASAFQSQNPYSISPQPQSEIHLPQEPIRRAATPASKLVARTLLLRHTPGHFSRGGHGGTCPWGALRAACGGRRYVGSGLRVEVC